MTRLTTPRRPAFWMLLTILSISTAGSNALAQFTQTNLVTNVQDPNLVNAWGLAYGAGSPFWVSDEGTGKSTVYDASGTIVSLVVTIPAATSGPKGTPTGIVANPTSGFVIAQSGTSGAAAFIFDTMDGTISGWNPSVNAGSAVIAVNNHATANYTGLAIATLAGKSFLYAANNAKNQIEVYNSSFKLVKTFTDASLTGFSVYGVQAIKNNLYVTFSGTAGGAVDVFSLSGTLVKTVTSNGSGGPLNAPWGVALAPSDFGVFSGALLVGNVGNGHINAFNLSTGKFKGAVKDTTGAVIVNPGLWALQFGGGGGSSSNGNTNQLFLTAGGGGYSTGVFAVIQE
jgi:uncharacterized protein (TIGR03118 family)